MYLLKANSFLLFFISAVLIAGCASSKSVQNKDDKSQKPTAQSDEEKEGELKLYDEVITDEAQTDDGLFTAYKVDDKYYYEIPDSLKGEEMLLISRIAKTEAGMGYGGEKMNTQTVRWQKRDKKILLRHVSYENVASDTTEPVYRAVQNSNFEPIIKAFDMQSLGKDSTGAVIEVTDLYQDDIPSLGLPQNQRQRYQVRRLDEDRSFINYVHSYPQNIEVRNLLTYQAQKPPSNASTGTISIEINHSMVLLSQDPMRKRSYDQRVGYFGVQQTEYGADTQKAEENLSSSKIEEMKDKLRTYKSKN